MISNDTVTHVTPSGVGSSSGVNGHILVHKSNITMIAKVFTIAG